MEGIIMNRPIVAILYDFDKTLSTTDMQTIHSFLIWEWNQNNFGQKLPRLLANTKWREFFLYVLHG